MSATNWWNSDTDSNLTRMLNKGMLKKADGSPMKYEDFRIVWKSDAACGLSLRLSQQTCRTDLKKAPSAKRLLQRADKKDKAAFDKLSDGKDLAFVPRSMSQADYLSRSSNSTSTSKNCASKKG